MTFTDSKGIEYKNFEFLDRGGMGKIYKGVSPITKEMIVLKLIENTSEDSAEKQKRELKVSHVISHKNVVKIYDSGITTIDGIEYLYLLEKYYPKGNLAKTIRKEIPIGDCYQMMQDLLLGLQEIHKTVIHRDLKPENILIDDDGSLVISDFGLSRFVNDGTHTDTFKGWGTYKYMSPECWTYEKNTPAMDIYSLGLIFFEILTGSFPFNPKSQTREEWRDCHLFSPVQNLANYRNDITVKLNQIIQKMTAKRLAERYQTIDEILTSFLDAKNQSSENIVSIERLAQKANRSNELKIAEELKKAKELEERRKYTDLLNSNIDDLFNRVEALVNQVNSKLETCKFTIHKNSAAEIPSQKSLSVSFLNKSFHISFLGEDAISSFEEISKQRYLQNQLKQYGLILSPYTGSGFLKNDIVLIGLAKTNFIKNTYEYGFNLLLKMDKDSNYGEWYIVQFSENITPKRTPFGISLFHFFDEYSKLENFGYFSKRFSKLEEKDILDLIEMISE